MKHVLWPFLACSVLIALISCSDDDSNAFEEQLALDILTIDTYLEENEIEAQVHPSGIRYVVEVEGNGDTPVIGNDVALKFNAFLLNGDTVGQDTIGFTINIDGTVIEAWQLMIPTMNEGGIITMYAPSVYCFGASGSVGIPPNANLIYSIELLERIDDEAEQLKVDTLIIDEYLIENRIQFQVDDSAIRYTEIQEGTGLSPQVSDSVRVTYEGRFLDGILFDSNTDSLLLENQIEAWQLMMPQMKEGGAITVYVPSRYGYGPSGTTGIAANTILVYEIELIAVLNEE